MLNPDEMAIFIIRKKEAYSISIGYPLQLSSSINIVFDPFRSGQGVAAIRDAFGIVPPDIYPFWLQGKNDILKIKGVSDGIGFLEFGRNVDKVSSPRPSNPGNSPNRGITIQPGIPKCRRRRMSFIKSIAKFEAYLIIMPPAVT